MASSSSSMSRFATSFIALIMFQVAFHPLIATNAQILNLIPTGVNINGQLCCPGSGATCPGFGIANTTVFVSCNNFLGDGNGNGSITILGQTLTDLRGRFIITLPIDAIRNFLSNPLSSGIPIVSCNITTSPLPIGVCPDLIGTSGVLTSVLRFVGTLVNGVIGLLLQFTVSSGFNVVA